MNLIKNKLIELGGYKPNVLLSQKLTKEENIESIGKLRDYFNNEIPSDVFDFIKEFGAISFNNEIKIISSDKIPVSNNRDAISVDDFYDLSNKDTSIIKLLNKLSGNIPEDLLPICDGEPGDLVVLQMQNINYGKIYYWYHDDDKLYLLANNFSNFISKLFVSKKDDEKVSDVKISKVSDKFLERLRKSRKL